MKKKPSKQTVIVSWISTVMCLVLIVGLAFALLKDKQNEQVPVTSVKIGEMDVDLVDAEGDSLIGKTMTWITGEVNRWEPGRTIYSEPFTVMNDGDLYFKYKLTLGGFQDSEELKEVMDFHIFAYDAKKDKVNTSKAYEGVEFECKTLGKADTFVIGATMKTTADNSYQGVRLKNANVILQAAQLDSDGVYAKVVLENKDNIDITQATQVSSYKQLEAAIAQATAENPAVIELKKNIEVPKGFTITSPVRIYSFGGHKLTLNATETLFRIENTGSLYLEGITLKSVKNTGSIFLRAYGDLTMESCKVLDVKALNSTESKDYHVIETYEKANITFINTRFSRCEGNRIVKDHSEKDGTSVTEMRNCSFLNNEARVMIELWTSYNVSGGTFSGNTTGQRSGGSLFFVAKSSQAILSLKSVTITNNVTLSKQAAVAWVQRGGALHMGGTTLIEGNTASLSYGNIKSSGGYVRINSGTIKPIKANGQLVDPEDHYTGLVKAGGNILIAKKAKIEGTSLGLD